jgi:hypothetical protein
MEIKGQSLIVSTVLIILLVIALTVIISQFAIPFVKDQLSESECFDILDKVSIVDSNFYTCRLKTDTESEIYDQINVQVHLADIEVDGFAITLGGASSKSFEIRDGVDGATNNLELFNGTTILRLPGRNEEKTYKFKGLTENYNSIGVYPILKSGKDCGRSDSVNIIEDCS